MPIKSQVPRNCQKLCAQTGHNHVGLVTGGDAAIGKQRNRHAKRNRRSVDVGRHILAVGLKIVEVA